MIMLHMRQMRVQTRHFFGILGATLILLFCFSHSEVALAADTVVTFDNDQQRELYRALTNELRCLKCQNQTLADSAAGLADDLRREIQTMILAGKGRDEIIDFLVQRYGDFVRYKPAFKLKTALLWLGPLLLLLVALIVAWRVARNAKAVRAIDPEQLEKARSLLKR